MLCTLSLHMKKILSQSLEEHFTFRLSDAYTLFTYIHGLTNDTPSEKCFFWLYGRNAWHRKHTFSIQCFIKVWTLKKFESHLKNISKNNSISSSRLTFLIKPFLYWMLSSTLWNRRPSLDSCVSVQWLVWFDSTEMQNGTH